MPEESWNSKMLPTIFIYVEFYCYSCFFLMHKSHMKPHGKPIFLQATTRLGLFSAIMGIKMRIGRSQEEIGWPNLAHEDMQKSTHRTTPYNFLRNNAELQYAFVQRSGGVLELRCLSHRQGSFNRRPRGQAHCSMSPLWRRVHHFLCTQRSFTDLDRIESYRLPSQIRVGAMLHNWKRREQGGDSSHFYLNSLFLQREPNLQAVGCFIFNVPLEYSGKGANCVPLMQSYLECCPTGQELNITSSYKISSLP